MTRCALLEELDRPHLKGLPDEPYAFTESRLRRMGVDDRQAAQQLLDLSLARLLWSSRPLARPDTSKNRWL